MMDKRLKSEIAQLELSDLGRGNQASRKPQSVSTITPSHWGWRKCPAPH